MKPASRYRLYMSGAIFIVLLNTLFAIHEFRELIQKQWWLEHTYDILTHTQTVGYEMSAANSAMRGYLLTGDPRFDARLKQAETNADEALKYVQKNTGDNLSQQERLPLLRQRMNVKLAALEAAMAIRRGHTGAAISSPVLDNALADSPDGKITVRFALDQVEREEHRLLGERMNAAARAKRDVVVAFALASVLDFVLLVITFQQLIGAREDQEQLTARAAQIATLNADLTVLNTALEERVEERTRELEMSNKELEAFSYSVSHDLRAPLRTIDGFSLALVEDYAECLDVQGQDYVKRVRGGVQRMGLLIDALLQLSRVTRSEAQRERVDLSQLATLVFQELVVNDADRNIVFSAEPGVTVEADPRLLRVALENLLGNAIKFTAKTPEPRIEFGQTTTAGQTVYFIRDNGAGFDMQYVDRLFTAFQRLHGDRDFKGSGIGLATVSRIIRRHHGTIWAEGQTGHGATFFFTLSS